MKRNMNELGKEESRRDRERGIRKDRVFHFGADLEEVNI